jgi:hypothetical protein
MRKAEPSVIRKGWVHPKARESTKRPNPFSRPEPYKVPETTIPTKYFMWMVKEGKGKAHMYSSERNDFMCSANYVREAYEHFKVVQESRLCQTCEKNAGLIGS